MRWFTIILITASLISARVARAYPSAEALGVDGLNPPFDFSITATLTGMILTSDERMVVSYGEELKLIDLGSYALEAIQPPALSSTAGTDGTIGGIAYYSGADQIVASQADGDILFFDLGDLSLDPTSVTVADGKALGKVALNPDMTYAYVLNTADHSVHVINLGARLLTRTIPLSLSGGGAFTPTDIIYIAARDEIYVATDAGVIFYFGAEGTTATSIIIDQINSIDLVSIAATTDGAYLYAVDSTDKKLIKINSSTHSTVGDGVDLSANNSLASIAITDVTNPSGSYAFIGGGKGISIVDLASDDVFDLGSDGAVDNEPLSFSVQPQRLVSSSSDDGNIYVALSSSKIGMLTANPFITISAATYSDGGTSLGEGKSVSITFQSNQAGSYEIRSGGGVTANGSLLIDSVGATSGTLLAETDQTVTINYDDNSSLLDEGDVDLWFFVTSGNNRGRRATTISVDTPPNNVVMRSTSFGSNKIYVTFDRLTVSDISGYNIYVDEDPDLVLTKSDIAAIAAQESSGGTITAEVSGLTNGTLYYIAVEGFDNGGNLSPARTALLADGTQASATPEESLGPLEMVGEGGCDIMETQITNNIFYPIASISMMALAICAMLVRRARLFAIALIIASSLFIPTISYAEDGIISESQAKPTEWKPHDTPQLWSAEVKTGFFMPDDNVLASYFGKCCNLITRVQGGLLWDKKYGAEISAGFLYRSGYGRSATSGAISSDRFTFYLIPMETNFTWRLDYFKFRDVLPYFKGGLDYVLFIEDINGTTRKGMKYGLHGGAGLQINIGRMTEVSTDLDRDYGINDLFLTLEYMYQWINNFGGRGLNLTGPVYSVGLLFEF